MKANLEISESGRVLRIFHENGRLISELLIHGPLSKVMKNCDEQRPILNGRPNVFRGECFGLAGYEFLNVSEERIEEKII